MFSGFCVSKTVPFHPNKVRKFPIVGYSVISEAFTETGPSHHEGTCGVSVKPPLPISPADYPRSEEHTSELQSRGHLVCRLLLEKKKITQATMTRPHLPCRHA